MADLIFSNEIKVQDRGVSVLSCPRCGSDYLHHVSVTSYDRNEDAKTVVKTVVSNGSTSTQVVEDAKSGNPSSRRAGLSIRFYCEGCGNGEDDDVLELTLAQHKGETEIAWRYSRVKDRAPA